MIQMRFSLIFVLVSLLYLIDAKPNIHKKERWQTINLQSRADEFVCPPGVDGFYPADDQNCTEDYYYCTVDGTAYLQQCPPGNVYDPVRPDGQPVCITPDLAYCKGYTDATSTEQTTQELTSAYPTSTESQSTSTEMTERTTTVETSPGTDDTTPSTISTTTSTNTTTPQTTSPGDSSSTTVNPGRCSGSPNPGQFTCPATTIAPNSFNYPYGSCSNCYWVCSNAYPILAICPGALVFNPTLGVCDYAVNVAGCSTG